MEKSLTYASRVTKYPHIKLKEWEVLEARRLYAEGVTQRELAIYFNVNHSTMQSLLERRSWKHL